LHFPGGNELRAGWPHCLAYSEKSPDVPYRPASDLIETIHPRVTFLVPEGMKSPDMLVRVSVAGSTVWWMGESVYE